MSSEHRLETGELVQKALRSIVYMRKRYKGCTEKTFTHMSSSMAGHGHCSSECLDYLQDLDQVWIHIRSAQSLGLLGLEAARGQQRFPVVTYSDKHGELFVNLFTSWTRAWSVPLCMSAKLKPQIQEHRLTARTDQNYCKRQKRFITSHRRFVGCLSNCSWSIRAKREGRGIDALLGIVIAGRPARGGI